MVAPFTTGQELSAADLNDAMEIGKLMFDTGPITADSTGWTTGTRIVTNVAGTFTGVVLAATYEVRIRANVIHDTAGKWATAGIAIHAGSAVTASDVPISAVTEYADSAGAVRNCSHSATFVATASGTYGVAIVGWVALGSGGTAKLHGTAVASGFTNALTVVRVA